MPRSARVSREDLAAAVVACGIHNTQPALGAALAVAAHTVLVLEKTPPIHDEVDAWRVACTAIAKTPELRSMKPPSGLTLSDLSLIRAAVVTDLVWRRFQADRAAH